MKNKSFSSEIAVIVNNKPIGFINSISCNKLKLGNVHEIQLPQLINGVFVKYADCCTCNNNLPIGTTIHIKKIWWEDNDLCVQSTDGFVYVLDDAFITRIYYGELDD